MSYGYWTCEPEWVGETAFIVAGGTSVNDIDVGSLKGRRVIVINSSAYNAPWADFLVWNDERWWRKHRDALTGVFKGRIVTTCTRVPLRTFGMKKVPAEVGIPTKRNELAMYRTTTQAAMSLAAHLGVARIVLIGVDLCERNGRLHHHEEHPWPHLADAFEAQKRNLEWTAEPLKRRGIEVINCSPISLLDCFPKRSLEDVLADGR